MHYRTTCSPAFQAKAKVLVSIIVMALVCLWPRASVAQQGVLPVLWLHSPIYQVNCATYSPDGTLLAVGGYGGIQILDATTGTLLTCVPTTCDEVQSVAFSPDGKTLADGGFHNNQLTGGGFKPVLELWSVSSGALITTLNSANGFGVYSVAFSPDGKTIADGGYSTGASAGGVLEFWNASNGERLTSPSLVSGTTIVPSVAFTPDGKVLYAGTDYGLQAFSTANYGLLNYYADSAGTGGGITSVAVSRSGSLLAYAKGGEIVVASNPFYNVSVPAPTSLSPSSATGRGAAFTLTVKGSGFVNGTTVNFNGTPLTTTFVSSKKVTASVSAADIASAGTASVTVVNPSNVVSNALAFSINNPKPVLSSISPNRAKHGSDALTITLTGSNFLSGSVVNWTAGGTTTGLATIYVSSMQLTATVPSYLLAAAGTATIDVFNPAPGGGTSAGKKFTIR